MAILRLRLEHTKTDYQVAIKKSLALVLHGLWKGMKNKIDKKGSENKLSQKLKLFA